MEDKYLQTVITGCAWCKSIVDITTHEASINGEEKFLLLSHGMCSPCREGFDFNDEEIESDENFSIA